MKRFGVMRMLIVAAAFGVDLVRLKMAKIVLGYPFKAPKPGSAGRQRR